MDLPVIAHSLIVPDTVSKAFAQVAPSGKLTIADILTYSGLGSAELAPLITRIQEDFEFGTGGEDTTKIGLTLPEIIEEYSFSFGAVSLLNVGQGSSGSATAGKITFSGLSIGRAGAGTSVSLGNPELYTEVTLYTPPSNGTGFVYSGPLTITDPAGNQIDGFVVGELLPAVQAGAAGSKGLQHFAALVLALNGSGVMNGGAGLGELNLGLTTIGDPITGPLLMVPPK
jgi:hypothetical protein